MATITVGGLPGTGTSTLCRALERALGLPYVYAGQLFRQEALKRGLTLEEMNALAQTDPTVDRDLDDLQLEYLRRGNVILEGRMAGWLARRHAIIALKVWLVCDVEERVRRLVQRDGGGPEDQRHKAVDRETRERDRYARYYGADHTDESIYDLVLDSTGTPPDALAGAIVQRVSGPPS